jgi:hypothetical protein
MTHRGTNYNLNHKKGSTPRKELPSRQKERLQKITNNGNDDNENSRELKFPFIFSLFFLIFE